MSENYKATYWSPRVKELPGAVEAAIALFAFIDQPTVFCVGVRLGARGRTTADSPVVVVHTHLDAIGGAAPETSTNLIQHLAGDRKVEARHGTATSPPRIDDLEVVAFRPSFPAENTEWQDRTTGKKWLITAVNYRPDLGDRLPTARMVSADNGELWDCALDKFCAKFVTVPAPSP